MRTEPALQRFSNRPGLVVLGSLLALASCDSGARVSATGDDAGIGPGAQSLNVDFRLRRDFFLKGVDERNGFLGDLVTEDLDGDGDMDLVQTNMADQTITIAYGTGFGDLPIIESFDVEGTPLRAAAGDVDGDGDQDIVVALTDQEFDIPADKPMNGLQIFFQDENGFSAGALRELGAAPFDLAVGKVGGGPADEIIVSIPEERRTRWFRMVGGELQLVQDLMSFAAGAFGRPLEVAIADIEGDGAMDVLVSEDQVEGDLPDRVVLYRNMPDMEQGLLLPGAGSGVGQSVPLFSDFNLQTPLVFSLGDVNADGREDIGVAEFDGTRALLVGLGDDGQLLATEIDFGAGVLALEAEDLNGDGFVDLAATLWNQGAVAVAYASAPGVFDGVSEHLSVGYFPRAIHAIDLDSNDPSNFGVDLMAANSQDLAYVAADEDGFRAAHGYLANDLGLPVRPNSLRSADLNGDDNADAVAIDVLQRKIIFLTGDGTGALEFVGSVEVSDGDVESPGYLLLRDIDGDGDLDLVTSIAEQNELAVLRNDGVLPFAVTSRIQVGNRPRGVGAADLDGDGILDLAVANYQDSTLQMCIGDGEGSFVAQTAMPVIAPPLAVEAYDVDGDGDADCVVSTGTGGAKDAAIVVLEGDGEGGLTQAAVLTVGAQAQDLFCGDLDGDSDGNGLCDIIVSQGGEITDQIFVFRNESTENGIVFESQPMSIGLNPGTLGVSDIDRDGDLDLLVLLGRGELVVARNDGTGAFPPEDYLPERDPVLDQSGELRGWSAPFGTVACSLADLDGDDLEDLVIVSPRTPQVWVARNQSTVPVDE